MRILQVVSFFSPQRGGGVIAVVYQLSRALARRGHDITIYTSDFELDQEYVDSLSGVRVRPFTSYLGLGGRPLLMPGALKQARAELKDFDIIHTHECRSFLNMVVHHYAHRYSVPYIVDAHGAAARKSHSRIKWFVDVLAGRRILQDACRVIAETELGAAEYRGAGVPQDRITILYPPFPVEDYSHLPQPGLFRERFGIGAKHIILYLGRINWIKGLDFLVESFHHLIQRRDDTVLAIVGSDDGYQSTLKKKIDDLKLSDKVLFVGYLGGVEKQAALVDADIMAQPSVYEQGLPWAAIEAVLCDTPIIVTRNTGADEDMKRMNGRYVVEYGNKEELSAVMQHILDNPDESAAETQKIKDYIMANLSMQKKVEEYERIYTSCLEQYGKAPQKTGV